MTEFYPYGHETAETEVYTMWECTTARATWGIFQPLINSLSGTQITTAQGIIYGPPKGLNYASTRK